MENWICELLELPEACQVEETLPKEFFSSNFNLTPGEKNLLNYSIKEVSIVGAIGPDYGAVPSSEGMESVAIILVETKGGKLTKEVSKLAEMLQNHLPQYVMIGLTDGEKACISIASKVNVDEVLEVKESFLTPPFAPEALVDMTKDFSFQYIDKTDLKALWDNYCLIVSQTK